jgi:hypothetical protein
MRDNITYKSMQIVTVMKRKFNNKKVEKRMSNLKKTAIAVLALSSGAVFAGTMGPVCSAVNVTVPCESTAWDLGGKALYFQPSISGANAGSSKTLTSGAGQSVDVGRNPKWGWGFMIEGSYHFNTGNDLNLNWYHVGTSRSGGFNGSTTITSNQSSLLEPASANIESLTINRVYNTVDPKWDMVNLEFGQHVDFGESKSIRFHGGFEFARLTANNSIAMNGSAVTVLPRTTPSFSTRLGTNPSYNGFGPRFGADMSYDWGNGLGIYANGATALLAGTSKYSTTATNVELGRSVTTSGSSTVVVPELEGKLGATYSYATAQGDLTFDAGWMWINYFNAVRSQSASVFSNTSDGNFGMQGVYFGLKWLGNVA